MVVVKRVVPPRTIFFLFAHDVPREVRDIYFLTIIGEHLKALGRVVKSVVVKVTRDREVGLVDIEERSARDRGARRIDREDDHLDRRRKETTRVRVVQERAKAVV